MQKRLYNKEPLNKLLVVKKPMYISSNSYLNKIKRKYKNKKAGFSGTLDPFACGCLIVAFGQYTKLFKYLNKTPKKYKAVLWLGVTSYSEDIENIIDIKDEKTLDIIRIENEIEKLKGDIEYLPPKYSAKKINGKRAYELARAGIEVEMKKQIMSISDIKLLSYNHPFITFEATVSEGSYIRSLAQILAKNLNVVGTLSYLERLNEGKFFFENEKDLNPIEYLNLQENIFLADKSLLDDGKKISIENLENKNDGKYIIVFEDFFSIIQISDKEVSYILNKVTI
ncbi:tRNA pseudouridine(55) synthase TruB [Malaciobacter molluscorum LMG 25693]|uniref:tRNA pseudouridine synthase B n=1 Tax=Malaciobacter molluscorum LMG 25693 TaxID=870501 RepID=A0A2G1DKA7_9BACT|nr:tRNA pseudouridine(55) synthase TruB [Malaciobacter molluscorum]AXX91308.1 tRNA pseudouridine 55 synthase [Malaciobacter molluscorum LMG 25693]PHO18938.1 tRNA pseudouridine(55) synthase TruB [Malaciobacter molluscorum LMG 25693]